MAALTWTTLETACLAETAKVQPPYTVPSADFAVIFPQATSYAEGRIYKEFGGLLATRQQNTSLQTTPSVRTVGLAGMVNAGGGPIIVPERFALFLPGAGGTGSPSRVQFDRASLDVIDMIWPQFISTQPPSLTDFNPRYWDLLDDHTIVMAPTPDAVYTCEVTGLFQPTPIGPGNESPTPLTVTSTYLSTVYPELLLAACMVYLCGALLHNFGAQSDAPQRAISWENLTQELMTIAKAEEMRRRGMKPNYPMPAPPMPARPAA
jgi:hypothetical protein